MADRRRGEEKHKDEDGRGGKKKDPFSLKDLAKSLPGNVASTTVISEKVDAGTRKRKGLVSGRNLWIPGSSSENAAGDPTSGKSLPGNVASTTVIPEKVDAGTRKRKGLVSDRNLWIPGSSSENAAGDPTSGKSLPGNVASTTDIPEKVDAGTGKMKPQVSNHILWTPEKKVTHDTSASRSENTASKVGGISLRRSSRLANPSGAPTSSSENTASKVGGISLRRTCKL